MDKLIGKILLLFALLGGGQLLAQEMQEELSTNLPVDRPDMFQLVFQRGFIIGGGDSKDQIPINSGNSGSLFFGGAFKLHLPGNVVAFRISPGINFFKLNYKQEAGKLFPSDTITYKSEKHRVTYAELPIGLVINFSKDEDGDSRAYMELGGFLGRQIGSIYKVRFDEAARDTKLRKNEVPNLEDWRYGLYGRIGYKRWGLFANYLMSDTFTSLVPEGGNTSLQELEFPPKLEIGISFFL